MNYTEEKELTKSFKEAYVKEIDNLIKNREKILSEERKQYIKGIFNNQEKYREDFKRMLGWPLVGYEKEGLPKVKSELLSKEDGYSIYRMQLEVIEGLNITGLLFKDDDDFKKPLVLVQHGGYGTPEHVAGFYGSTDNYNEMLKRVKENNVNVFAPQLLLWHPDYNVEYNRVNIDARLKRVGSSVTALEVFALTRVLDYFEKQSYVSTLGMVGLSYGGFYTLFLTAADTRIKSAISSSFFNKRDEVPWSDWTWFGAAGKFDDAEIASLIFPRKFFIRIGKDDPLFCSEGGVKSFKKLEEICKEVGTSWVDFKVFEGKHEFFKDDEPIKELIKELNI